MLLCIFHDNSSRAVNLEVNIFRSADYGESFQLIDSQLDPQIEDPLLWRSFFVSPVNKNLVSIHKTLPANSPLSSAQTK